MHEVIAEDDGPRRHLQCLRGLLGNVHGTLRVASAYVTDADLLISVKSQRVCLLTSVFPMDIASGATSLKALRSLIESGVECRCLRDHPRFHAKVYIFGEESAVVTSANLTESALHSNIEVGVQIAGSSVRQLTAWFDEFWAKAKPLNVSQIDMWQLQTAALRRSYFKLSRAATSRLMPPNDQQPSAVLSDDLRDLLENATQFFVCNTDRRQGTRTPNGGYVLEEEMYGRCYAAAWESFKFPTHMERVRPRDAIFMFAKGVGIIGIGRADATCEILQPNDPHRIRDSAGESHTPEWRVPVHWLDWRDDEDAYPCKAPNFTFWNVTDVQYTDLREGVRNHFLGE